MKRYCLLCERELKPLDERFCESCVKNRSMDSRLRVLQRHFKKSNSKYLRKL